MKKVLFTATIDEHILSFHIPFIKWFKSQGYEVHVASKGNKIIPLIDKKHNVDFERSPFKISNIIAYTQLKKIINENSYDLIHCHTPMGATLTRLAARKARIEGTKVLYTAHGFHFLKGAALKNWIIYYPIEKWLSKFTDCLITINEEDYNTAINKKFKANEIKLIHGVGVDLNKFELQIKSKKDQIRKEYGYKEDDFILFYAAELNSNKHQDLLIDVINILKNRIPNIKLLLAGTGTLQNKYKARVKQLGLETNIEFLGYRNDIKNLLMLSDLVVASSRREGLPVNVMEAMATGLPLVVTDVRGHKDLVQNGVNGYVVGTDDVKDFVDSIEKLHKDERLRKEFGEKGLELVQNYGLKNVMEEMKEIYVSQLGGILMAILVTGGAGYIGSHTSVELLEKGYEIIIVDNFSNSKPEILDKIKDITRKSFLHYNIDLLDSVELQKIFSENEIEAVIHFAGYKAVGESVEQPLKYYKNNIIGTLNLLEVMNEYNIKNIVFSSSATVYGDPNELPIKEDFSLSVTNPYGRTKLMIEEILGDLYHSDNYWNIVILRYFNPIGAHESGLIGEEPNGTPNNLMPYITQVASGKLEYLNIYGNDYPTIDGTGVRDYIHVVDLAKGHIKALQRSDLNKGLDIYNIGTGKGYSVLEIVKAFEKINDVEIPYRIIGRREGDIAECYADPKKAEMELGWKANKGIEEMCRDAWRFQLSEGV